MAFYQLNMRTVLGNAKLSRWHLDFETPVSLTGSEQQQMVDDAAVVWNAVATRALYSTDTTLGQCEIFQFERQDNCPAAGAAVFVCPDGSQRFVRHPLTVVRFSATGGVAGTAITTSLPPQCSLVVSLRTGLPGRRFFGRAYTPPPPEGESDGTGLVSQVHADLVRDRVQAIAVAVEGAILPVDVDHVVYSVRFDQQAEVTTYAGKRGIDTQRRRRVRPLA